VSGWVTCARKLFRGAKVEDLIHDLDYLSRSCEQTALAADDPMKRRFYEGLSVAYYMVAQKLKGRFEYVEEDVVNQLYTGRQQVSARDLSGVWPGLNQLGPHRLCSFCGRDEREVGPLAPGPRVTICGQCAEFAREVIEHARGPRS
jgi:ClpX C4-type zinc finger